MQPLAEATAGQSSNLAYFGHQSVLPCKPQMLHYKTCLMLQWFQFFVFPWRVLAKSPDIFAYLNCDGHESWRSFREALQGLNLQDSLNSLESSRSRQRIAELASFADVLLVEHFASINIGNFVSILSEPGLTVQNGLKIVFMAWYLPYTSVGWNLWTKVMQMLL